MYIRLYLFSEAAAFIQSHTTWRVLGLARFTTRRRIVSLQAGEPASENGVRGGLSSDVWGV